jgi:nitric oxide dioxygenase
MFKHNPELKNVFNMGNQQSGKQQTALANAVLAYAENIANPSVLMPAIDNIGHKHTSLDIRPEHYIIVGNHLIASIQEVLGEAATPEIIDAWTAAYNQLADLMTGHEAGIYKAQTLKQHGWTGWRLFKIMRKEAESSEICSFYLYPADGGKVPLHKPGQFISIKLLLPELKMNQIRQYSISSVPSETHYRISVKRETHATLDINGMISNYLHDKINIGSFVELSAPAGNFVLPEKLNAPIVFISGGVGITPFMSMIEHVIQQDPSHPITLIHGCRNESVHAFKEKLKDLSTNPNFKVYTFYDQCGKTDKHNQVYEGFLDINRIDALQHKSETDYYICGPSPFIQKQFSDLKKLGIDSKHIFFEEFGPQLLHLN